MTLGIFRRLRRSRHRRRLLVGAVAAFVFVLALALFLRSYSDSGPTSPAAAPSAPATDDTFDPYATSAPAPTATGSPTSSFFPSGVRSLPNITISGLEGGGLHFAPGVIHTVTMSAHSAAPIGQMGYIVPTSSDHSYGHMTIDSGSWSLTTNAVGKPAYAIIFIQAGKLGIPITCTITVDGKVTSTSTTNGPYGRTVCLG